MAFRKVYVQYIHLADAEWSSQRGPNGGPLMDEVAAEFLAAHPDREDGPVVVMVNEHAGWYLGYARVEGRVRAVYSANDAALYTGAVARFRAEAYSASWEHISPPIRRQDVLHVAIGDKQAVIDNNASAITQTHSEAA